MDIKTKYYATLPNGTTIEAASMKILEKLINKELPPIEQEITVVLKFQMIQYCSGDDELRDKMRLQLLAELWKI